MKPAIVALEEGPGTGLWIIATSDASRALNLSVKNKKAAEKIAKILNDQASANNIVWAE